MSVSSEETHDNSERVNDAEPKDCHTGEIKGRAEQGTGPATNKRRKRKLSEAKVTDAPLGPDDEQLSFQSAFQQYRPLQQQQQQQQQQHPHSGSQPAISTSQTVQLLLKAAAQSNAEDYAHNAAQQRSEVGGTSTNSISMSHAPHDYPSTSAGGMRMRLSAQYSRTYPPTYNDGHQHEQQAQPPSHTPPTQHSIPRATPSPPVTHAHALNPLYTPPIPKPKVSRQLVTAVTALEHPGMDADTVQAALEFAAALEIGSEAASTLSRHIKQLSASRSIADSIKLLQVLEISTGRLDVLRILTCRLTTSSSPVGKEDTNMLSQLLLVIQDLMRDMESSQRLLQRAGAVLQGHKQAALHQVKSLKAYHQAMQVFWTQGQQLDRFHLDRHGLLQHMLMQPVDETGQDMLDMFESLRQSLVGVLEAGARRKAASSEMQAAQAQLARQGVSGITSDGMLSGSVQLVIDRAGIRLDMLQRIVSCLENSQAGLLAALVLTLDAPSWQHASEPQLVEAINGTRTQADHLLAQLRAVGHSRGLSPIKTAATAATSSRETVLDGIHDTLLSQSQPAAPDTHLRHKEEEWMAAMLARQKHSGRGSLPPEQPWATSGSAKKSKLDPRQQPGPPAMSPTTYADAAQVHSRDTGEHVVLRPHAQRPSGQLPSLQPGACLPFPTSSTGPNRLTPAPSSDSPSAGDPRRRSHDRRRPHQEEELASQDNRASSEEDRAQPPANAARPNVLQLLSSLGDFSRSQTPAAAKPASPSLAREASLAGSLPGSAREGTPQAHRLGSMQQQGSQSPRQASPYTGAQADPQSIAAAYAQLCAFLKQQNQPPPPPL